MCIQHCTTRRFVTQTFNWVFKMVLNPKLYERLEEEFGKVKVTKRGQKSRWKVKHTASGRWGRKVGSAGDEYRVDCPFCTDSRARLYISYLYGSTVEDEDGRRVRFGGGLAHCFNETHCMQDETNRDELWRVLIRNEEPLLFKDDGKEKKISQDPVYPKKMRSLHDLPADHRARRYVEGRDFDPDRLGRLGFAYVESDPRDAMVQDTIFIPFLDMDGNLAGGQCRRLTSPETNWPPKYCTLENTPVRSVLFGGWRAREQDMVVVTEGPFDALRVGTGGVATLGSQVSRTQAQLLARHWDVVVFAFDGDLGEQNPIEITSLHQRMETLRGPAHGLEVHKLELPPGRDPADHGREELWQKIKKKLDTERRKT